MNVSIILLIYIRLWTILLHWDFIWAIMAQLERLWTNDQKVLTNQKLLSSYSDIDQMSLLGP